MALVATIPDQEGRCLLYEIPEADLAKYAIPADKAAEMFPKKESHTREDARGVIQPKAEGDVQAYSAAVCWNYYWWGGYWYYEWWYC